MGLSWYHVHILVLNDLDRLFSVHIMHTTLVVGWVDSMALYELAVFDPSDLVLDPMWRKGDCNESRLVWSRNMGVRSLWTNGKRTTCKSRVGRVANNISN
ncbi:hypothetical protein MTR67_043185 [Solanum verrucosum]|uniref:Uncharacterized protein n=1 Tax=Solanum verrucosum TaxID=315347 RepID=A0AAF0UPT6_SOLVR|nr:hypothetical protein MTR67_043185 [Solanum verrucosum]